MEQLTVLPRTTFGLSTRVSHIRAEDDAVEELQCVLCTLVQLQLCGSPFEHRSQEFRA